MDELRKREKLYLDAAKGDNKYLGLLGLREILFKTHNFDSKDGENTTLKAIHTAKLSAIIATWASSYDILGISHCKTLPTIFARWGAYTGPAVMSAGMYVFTVSTLANLREESDWLNHSIAGVTAGAVIGALKQNTVLGSRCAFYFAIVGGIYAECRRNGVMLMDARPNKEYGYGFDHYKRQLGMPAEKKQLPDVY